MSRVPKDIYFYMFTLYSVYYDDNNFFADTRVNGKKKKRLQTGNGSNGDSIVATSSVRECFNCNK